MHWAHLRGRMDQASLLALRGDDQQHRGINGMGQGWWSETKGDVIRIKREKRIEYTGISSSWAGGRKAWRWSSKVSDRRCRNGKLIHFPPYHYLEIFILRIGFNIIDCELRVVKWGHRVALDEIWTLSLSVLIMLIMQRTYWSFSLAALQNMASWNRRRWRVLTYHFRKMADAG